MRKSSRKLLGIMLAASLAITSAFPMQGVAAEQTDSEYQDIEDGSVMPEEGQSLEGLGQAQQPEDDGQPQQPARSSQIQQPEEPMDGQQPSEEGQQPEEPMDGQQPSTANEGSGELEDQQESGGEVLDAQPSQQEGMQPSEGQGSQQEGTQPSDGQESQQEGTQPSEGLRSPEGNTQPEREPESQKEDMQPSEEEELSGSAEQKTFLLPQGDGDEAIQPLEGSYDINQPVIERFEFVEQGQTLTQESTLHFKMYVYDSDSDVKSITVELYNSRHYNTTTLNFQKGNEENLYTAEISGSQLREGNHRVSSIRVEDEKNNYVDGAVTGEYGEYLYQFTIKYQAAEVKVTLSDLKMEIDSSNEDGTLSVGDTVTYTANLQCEGDEFSKATMYAIRKGDYSNQGVANGVYDQDTGVVSATLVVDDKMYPAEWGLYQIRIHTSTGKYFYFTPSDISPEAEVKFTVVNPEYDNLPPVVERIDIGGNGRTVQAGDVIEIKVKVKEDHPKDSANMYFDPEDPIAASQLRVKLNYQKDTQEYIGNINITDATYPGTWKLSGLNIYDTYGNVAYLSNFKGDEEGTSRHYIVSPDGYDTEKPVIQGISLDTNGKAVKTGDTVTLKVEAEEKNPSGGSAQFEWKDSDYPVSRTVNLSYNEAQQAYIGRIYIEASTNPGTWELSELSICDKNKNTASLQDFEGLEEQGPWSFTVDESGYDVNGPLVQSITIDKNGQFVQPGETVNIRVKVEEKNPEESGGLYFYPQAKNVSSYIYVELRYNHAEGEYVGSIPITDDTYPCEWALTRIEIKDKLRQGASTTEELAYWQSTYPWYFKVKSGNTYREDFKNVEFNFYGLQPQEDGSYRLCTSVQNVEHVGRRASLKDLGIFPQPIEGVTATWTLSWGALKVGEDTELLFHSTEDMSYYLFAAYDKGCANVSLTYMSEDNGEQTVIIPVFVEKEATYKDVLEALELPEDAKADDFAEFLLRYSTSYHNWDTVVGDVANISAIADYKNCQTTWNARYIGQDGKETSKVITKSYVEGTTVADALAELEKPEDANGMEGEGWALLGADGNQVLSKEMVSFDIVALYRGRTTLDVSYTYRGEDGTMEGGSKLLVIEGEGLSDAAVQGEATNAFKEASHLPGLMLSEWAGTVDVNQEKYKKIQFQAIYYNCVVVLKYPDETCQYVVVDKNAAFSLPTENETYTDILWEGFEQGQSVTITEDREFLAADARRKDGTEEKPEGERLTEEEIARIKEEIEKAEAGASVKIDMKKATVVPKEVLEAIKGKPVDIVLDMGSYSWTIDGAEVNATDLKDIDLEVTIGTDTVPSALVSSIAEGKPATQLSLTHNGEFGFRADLTLNFGSENSGSYGNLYYYDSSGKLVFRNAGQIGADGSTTLSFSHASDYVAVIDKVMHTGTGTDKEPAEGTDKETAGGTDSGTKAEENSNGTTGGTNSSTMVEPDNSGTEETSGNGGENQDVPDRTGINFKEPEEKEPEEREEKDSKKNGGDQLTASIKKNTGSITTDSGSTGAATSASSLKSPKTGE